MIRQPEQDAVKFNDESFQDLESNHCRYSEPSTDENNLSQDSNLKS